MRKSLARSADPRLLPEQHVINSLIGCMHRARSAQARTVLIQGSGAIDGFTDGTTEQTNALRLRGFSQHTRKAGAISVLNPALGPL
jgi:hypothetical protein